MIYSCSKCNHSLDFSALPSGQYACPVCGQQFNVPAISTQPPPIIRQQMPVAQAVSLPYHGVNAQAAKPKWPKYGLLAVSCLPASILFYFLTLPVFISSVERNWDNNIYTRVELSNHFRDDWDDARYSLASSKATQASFSLTALYAISVAGYFFYKDSQG